MLSPHSDDKVLDKLNQCANKEQFRIWHVIGLDEKDFTLPTNGKCAHSNTE